MNHVWVKAEVRITEDNEPFEVLIYDISGREHRVQPDPLDIAPFDNGLPPGPLRCAYCGEGKFTAEVLRQVPLLLNLRCVNPTCKNREIH